jgi:hypothetical protein
MIFGLGFLKIVRKYFFYNFFAKKTHVAIFQCENSAKWILFSKSKWITRKKNFMEIFFGLILGQKSFFSLKMVQNRQN